MMQDQSVIIASSVRPPAVRDIVADLCTGCVTVRPLVPLVNSLTNLFREFGSGPDLSRSLLRHALSAFFKRACW